MTTKLNPERDSCCDSSALAIPSNIPHRIVYHSLNSRYNVNVDISKTQTERINAEHTLARSIHWESQNEKKIKFINHI